MKINLRWDGMPTADLCLFYLVLTYHLVEPGRIFEAVSYFNQLPFFVILGGSDVVQLGCQFLYVATEMLYCLQPVPKVTKKEKGFKKFLKRPAKS